MLQISGVRPLLRRPKGWISTPPKPLRSHPGFRLFHTPVIQTRSSGSSRHTGSPGNSLRSLHTFMQKPLSYDSGPLVWIDCEMTGLDPTKDRILEIAVLITDGNLELVHEDGIEFVIKTEKKHLDAMDEWCTNQHASSGLTQACIDSPYTTEYVAKAVLSYIQKWVPGHRTAVLAGNSVHADRSFLVREMPEVVDWLHYRIVDVSSIKELSRRWYPSHRVPGTIYSGKHRALDDIKGSIRELKWYRENIFIQPGSPPPGSPSA